MLSRKSYWYATVLLFVLPLLIAATKFNNKATSLPDLLPKEVFDVSLEFDLSNLPDTAFVKAYLPRNNARQVIRHIKTEGDSLVLAIQENELGKRGKWLSANQSDAVFSYNFEVEGKAIQFTIPNQSPFEQGFSEEVEIYLKNTKNIQSDDPLIDSLAQSLKGKDINITLKNNFDFVQQITNSNTGVLTDAITALKRNRASCNGKSRLFVALCRAQGIPARVVGGIILENAQKRTSHLWTEIYCHGYWLPFDILNHHFATLPAHYLELHKGDRFLITHSKSIGFDYQFSINKKYQTAESIPSIGPQLWSLLSTANIPLNLLRSILLFPLAALVIAIFRNVVGLKTFGIFLPVLIAIALVNVHFLGGILAFSIVILLVSGLHFVLEKWGLLHIPKVVIMLTTVVLTMLAISLLGIHNGWENFRLALFLPIVVLSMTAERFAKTLVEEDFSEALKILGATFFIALLCYPIFQSNILIGFFLTYPEFYFSILGIMLLLGRWIGMRVLEYKRFAAFSA